MKEEVMPIAWHRSRYWDWCIPEDEKKRNRTIMGINIGFFDRYKKFDLYHKHDQLNSYNP